MKKIILAIVVSITAMVANSQSSDPLRDKLDSIFNFIDKTQIPTGY